MLRCQRSQAKQEAPCFMVVPHGLKRIKINKLTLDYIKPAKSTAIVSSLTKLERGSIEMS